MTERINPSAMPAEEQPLISSLPWGHIHVRGSEVLIVPFQRTQCLPTAARTVAETIVNVNAIQVQLIVSRWQPVNDLLLVQWKQ